MLEVHRLDGTAIHVNAELVETVESTPDTVITLVNGHRYIVLQTAEDVVDGIRTYRQQVAGAPLRLVTPGD